MNNSATDVAAMLSADSSLNLVQGINLFIGKEPNEPNTCVVLFDTPGRPPHLSLGDQGYEFPSIQIRVRSADYVIGWSLIEDIKNLLHGRGGQTWNSTLYSVIYCASGPFHLDWDELNRARFVINFDIQRRL